MRFSVCAAIDVISLHVMHIKEEKIRGKAVKKKYNINRRKKN